MSSLVSQSARPVKPSDNYPVAAYNQPHAQYVFAPYPTKQMVGLIPVAPKLIIKMSWEQTSFKIAVAQWLRHYATSRKVAGSIRDVVI
jgi:hypothetical protein